MPRPRPVVPPYRHHKARDLAYTFVDGKQVYLGRYGSAQSRELHARIVREASVGRPAAAVPKIAPEDVTIGFVVAAFWDHARRTYPHTPAPDGKRPDGEVGNYWDALRPLAKLYATTPAVQFGPKALALVQDEMVAMGLCRNVINRHTVRIRTIIKWAVGQELIPGEVHHRLSAVRGLRPGERGVRSTAKVLPVPADVLDATLAQLSPRLAAMVRLQLLTGMRSGNLVTMRTAEIDTSGGDDGTGAWIYRPRKHKTEHHGHVLAIRIGPKAQEVLRPWLKPGEPEAYLWSPADEVAELRAARAARRKTPLSCGNHAGTHVARSPKKRPGAHYTPGSYAACVTRACDRANRWAKGGMIIGDDERVIPRWHPHQLRHNRGTAVRAKHGVDGVLAALGQRSTSMADRYAEIEASKAELVAADLG